MGLDYKKLRKKFEVFIESIDQEEFDNWLKKERDTENIEKLSMSLEHEMNVFKQSITLSSGFDIIEPTTINLSNKYSSCSFNIHIPLPQKHLAENEKQFSIAA